MALLGTLLGFKAIKRSNFHDLYVSRERVNKTLIYNFIHHHIRSVLKELSELITSTKNEDEMQNYKLATHSFGTLNLTNNIELLTSILQTQSDVLNGQLCSEDVSMETESGLGSKNSSIDDPHM